MIMTQEEKQVLLKDLCARIPHHPKGVKLNTPFDPKDITIVGYTGRFVETVDDEIEAERVRLYLRPMSSMTSDERFEYDELQHFYTHGLDFNVDEVDWLIAHHFDYRGLIDKGLAFEAPEGMYKTE